MKRALPLLAIAALLLTALWPARRADACGARGRRGPISIEGEEALIVWDAARRRMHFVRRAAFGVSEDFGFLVPTPHQPDLSEVSDRVFDRLFDIYRQRARRTRGATRARGGSGGGGGGVRVLERRTVAGLDTAVLAASDSHALDAWLRGHGYQSDETLRQWYARYVQAGWIITAFRIDPGSQTGGFKTRSVRMSFRAREPYFPYSEPQDSGRRPRPFRVSVIAPHRMEGRVNGQAWGARVGYANRLSNTQLDTLLRNVMPRRAVAQNAWLTVFDEPRSVRGEHDVTFRRAASQTVQRSTLRSRVVMGGDPRGRSRSGSLLEGL